MTCKYCVQSTSDSLDGWRFHVLLRKMKTFMNLFEVPFSPKFRSRKFSIHTKTDTLFKVRFPSHTYYYSLVLSSSTLTKTNNVVNYITIDFDVPLNFRLDSLQESPVPVLKHQKRRTLPFTNIHNQFLLLLVL